MRPPATRVYHSQDDRFGLHPILYQESPQSVDVSIVSNAVLLEDAWLQSLHLEGFLDCPILDGESHHVFLGDQALVAQVVEVEHSAVCH